MSRGRENPCAGVLPRHKICLAKEKPWAAVLPNGEKKLALGEGARSGSPVGSESAYEGRTLELCVLPKVSSV